MPILTLLFRNLFSPCRGIVQAARVDGADSGHLFQDHAAHGAPIFVVAIILQVTGIWNDFLFVRLHQPTLSMTVQLNNIVNSVQA